MKNRALLLLLISTLTFPVVAQRSDYDSGRGSGPGSDSRSGDWRYDGGYDGDRSRDGRGPSNDSGRADTRGLTISPRPDRDRFDEFDVKVYTDKRTYTYGQGVRIYVKATRDAYLYIFSTDANGVKRQIFPNYYERDNWVNGGTTYSFPSRGYSLKASPPSGTETISVVAVRERFRHMDRYKDYSKSNPFPKSYGAATLKTRIEPEGRRGRFFAEDSTTIRIRRPER